MARYTQPYDTRRNQRDVSRALGLDPGGGPSLEDAVRDLSPEQMPSLDTLTDPVRGEHPPVASLDAAPTGRERSSEGDYAAVKERARGRADFAREHGR